MIEVFPNPDVTGKVLYLVAAEMDERYKRRLFPNWDRIIEGLKFIRTVKYGSRVTVDALCLHKIVDAMYNQGGHEEIA